MHAHKLKVTIPKDHRLVIAVDLPADFPAGPAELIVLASPSRPFNGVESRQPQSLAILDEIHSLELTSREEDILEDFERFRREHPFRLVSLDEDR